MSSLTSKKETALLLIWLGRRLLDFSDLSAFERERDFAFPYLEILHPNLSPALQSLSKGRRERINHQKEINEISTEIVMGMIEVKKRYPNLIALVILDAFIAQADWYPDFAKKIKRAAYGNTLHEIIYGLGLMVKSYHVRQSMDKKNPYSPGEQLAAELGMIGISFNSDAPTNSACRLAAFIKRIMGRDLPDKKFPAYSLADLQRMAWHINRENFNFFSKDPSAIPKYTIGSDDRPIFTVPPIADIAIAAASSATL